MTWLCYIFLPYLGSSSVMDTSLGDMGADLPDDGKVPTNDPEYDPVPPPSSPPGPPWQPSRRSTEIRLPEMSSSPPPISSPPLLPLIYYCYY